MIPLVPPEPPRSPTLIRVAVGVSIAIHVAAAALSLGYTGSGLFDSREEQAVSVTVVTPEQVAALAEITPLPELKLDPESDKRDRNPSPADAKSQASKAEASPARTEASPSKAEPPPAKAEASTPGTSLPQPQQKMEPAFSQPQPDISLKYQVDLGLKPLPMPTASALQPSGGTSEFDAPAASKADIDDSNVAAFRAQLKQCAVLPAAVSGTDHVVIVLRARFTPDGRLAAAPILIEASASVKGPALMQAAIAALQSCQPFKSLPADKYAEWRVLDLRFTPQDFRKG